MSRASCRAERNGTSSIADLPGSGLGRPHATPEGSGVDVGFEDARRDLPGSGGLGRDARLQTLQRLLEVPEGLGARRVERQVAEVLHELRALDVEVEVGV